MTLPWDDDDAVDDAADGTKTRTTRTTRQNTAAAVVVCFYRVDTNNVLLELLCLSFSSLSRRSTLSLVLRGRRWNVGVELVRELRERGGAETRRGGCRCVLRAKTTTWPEGASLIKSSRWREYVLSTNFGGCRFQTFANVQRKKADDVNDDDEDTTDVNRRLNKIAHRFKTCTLA